MPYRRNTKYRYPRARRRRSRRRGYAKQRSTPRTFRSIGFRM